jgi:hypothetical protein
MMNDRFSAQLRGHLLRTADTRPADGQLAAIDELVAVTAQRHPLVARLPWSRGRINPFPSVALRYGLIAIGLIIALVAAALAAGFGPTRRTVFEGTWTSIDVPDGSEQTLVVGHGTSPAVHFVDDFASGAACVNDDVKVFTMDGRGTVVDDRLTVVWPDGGGCGLMTVFVAPGSYRYDKASDTITDGYGITWTRVAGAVVPPSNRPVTEATPRPSSTTDSNCIQFDAPGTYTAPVGSLSLTVSVPGASAAPWNGERDQFDLEQAACTDWSGPGSINASEVTRVDTEACTGPSLAIDTAAEAIAAVSAAKGIEVISQTGITVGGYAGTRFDITILDASNACPNQQIPLVDGVTPFDAGLPVRLYLIDVEGKTLALALYGYALWDRAVIGNVDAIVASMRIAPTPEGTPAPPPSPRPAEGNPQCIDYRDGGTYAQSVDPLTVTATLPAGTENGWWGGRTDVFAAVSDTCLFSAAVELQVSGPIRLLGDACHRGDDSRVDIRSRAQAIEALSADGLDSSPPTEATLGGYAASMIELSVPEGFDLQCVGEPLLLWYSGPGLDATIEPGETVRVYLVDVDGLILGVTVTWSADDERVPAKMAELDAILASLRIEPQ